MVLVNREVVAEELGKKMVLINRKAVAERLG